MGLIFKFVDFEILSLSHISLIHLNIIWILFLWKSTTIILAEGEGDQVSKGVYISLCCLKEMRLFYFFSKHLLIIKRQRQTVSRGGAERDTHTESEADSRLWDVSTEPHVGLELVNREIMTLAQVRTEPPRHPEIISLFKCMSIAFFVCERRGWGEVTIWSKIREKVRFRKE